MWYSRALACAKAYSFPFFILNIFCCTWFMCDGNKLQWLKISLVSCCGMVLCSLPWIWALHAKYGIWTTSTAGTLNMSWYLVGHPHWREGIRYLLPPAYPDSPWYWEDPYYANGDTPHFWNSFHLLGLQCLRIGFNLWRLLRSMLQLSVFLPVIAVVLTRFVLVAKRNEQVAQACTFTVALCFLLFPLGSIMLINFEPRYIWYLVPLSMLAGGLFILNHLSSNRKIFKIIPYVFALSYLVYPTCRMAQLWDEGTKAEYNAAQQS